MFFIIITRITRTKIEMVLVKSTNVIHRARRRWRRRLRIWQICLQSGELLNNNGALWHQSIFFFFFLKRALCKCDISTRLFTTKAETKTLKWIKLKLFFSPPGKRFTHHFWRHYFCILGWQEGTFRTNLLYTISPSSVLLSAKKIPGFVYKFYIHIRQSNSHWENLPPSPYHLAPPLHFCCRF